MGVSARILVLSEEEFVLDVWALDTDTLGWAQLKTSKTGLWMKFSVLQENRT